MKIQGSSIRLAVILLAITFASSCKKNPVGPQVMPNVQLSLDYATCTEVWLKLGFTDSPGGGDYRITRDGAMVLTGTITGSSAVLYDTTAQASKSYSYTAYRLVNGQVKQISPSLQATTLDSTSHDFVWQTFELGEGNGSRLYDVTIVNDTVYAVGEIYQKDSSGQFSSDPFNLAKWDGEFWTLWRIGFYTICGQSPRTPYPASSIFAVSSNDFWISAAGDQVTKWDGTSQLATACLPVSFSLYKLWGENDYSVFGVGDGGNIVHFDGSQWQAVPSGTGFLVSNIWGSNGRILCVTTRSELLSIRGNLVWDTLAWSGIPIRGIWFGVHPPIFVSGQGVWMNDIRGWRRMDGLPEVFYTSIEGTALNDIMCAGPYGTAAHYNGSSWHVYTELANSIWNFQSAAITKNVVAIVGGESVSIGGKGVVAIGKRIN